MRRLVDRKDRVVNDKRSRFGGRTSRESLGIDERLSDVVDTGVPIFLTQERG
jgi:hypothetical protein